jgi:TolA-binding protein
LAAAGEIGHDDWQALKAHLEECAPCRAVFADVGEIHAKWLPEHPDFEITREPHSELRLRKAILKRATKAGARFSKAAQAQPQFVEAQRSLWGAARPWLWGAAATAVLIVSTGVLLQRMRPQSVVEKKAAATAQSVSKAATPVGSNVDAQNQWQQAQLALERALKASAAQQARLRQQLEAAEHRAEALAQSSADANRSVAELRQQLDAAHTAQAQTEAQLADLRSAQSTNEVVTLVQEKEIQALNQKLREQSASVDREGQLLSAGREIRDLIAARNLHIIDVYDTDGHGKTSRAFGRVFYTEGKSLVFYAYDLSSQHPENSKYAFYVWGKRDGTPQMAKNLGALTKEDQAQKRWVLTITDPRVLAEIDSVFVTLEPTGQAGERPSGKRLLTAFLSTAANHP